jgi:type IV pilus assembly protein PilN
VYLRSISQKGLRINLLGYAQSNARVSTLMRNIESSQWLESPKLNEIKAAMVGTKRVSEFNLDLSLKRAQGAADSAAGKGAAGKAGPAPAAPAAAAKKG